MPSNEYIELPSELQRIHTRVDNVKDDLKDEIIERKENNKIIFEKFDKMNNMIIYQLGAAILTLVIVIFMLITK